MPLSVSPMTESAKQVEPESGSWNGIARKESELEIEQKERAQSAAKSTRDDSRCVRLSCGFIAQEDRKRIRR